MLKYIYDYQNNYIGKIVGYSTDVDGSTLVHVERNNNINSVEKFVASCFGNIFFAKNEKIT